MVQQSANPAADTADPVSNAVVSPEASFFLRQILQNALKPGASGSWVPEAQALLANVLMNDVLNNWNNAGQNELAAAQNFVNQAGNLALAHHAQGMIYRAQGDHAGALTAFQQALQLEPGFARAQAQIGNQSVLGGGDRNQARTQIQKAIDLNPLHPASGYFYWGMGRAYFVDQNWRDAITWLCKSVNALPTVAYNRTYLAAAKQHAGDTAGAQQTMQDFLNDPRFGRTVLAQAVASLQNPTGPTTVVAARQKVHDFLQQF